MELCLSLLKDKTAKWHRATKFGEGVLAEFATVLQEHLGYPVLSWTRPIKQWGRIHQKVAHTLRENSSCSPQDAADQITDIAGGRLLVIGLSDLDAAEKHFPEFIATTYKFQIWPFKRYVESCRPGGFRGLAGGMHMMSEDLQQYPFEVQIMTPLQDTWDKLQHPVYERIRTSGGGGEPEEVDSWFQCLSERFYVLDQEISQQQQNFRTYGLL